MSWLKRTTEGFSKAAIIPLTVGGAAAAEASSRGVRLKETAIIGLLGFAASAITEA